MLRSFFLIFILFLSTHANAQKPKLIGCDTSDILSVYWSKVPIVTDIPFDGIFTLQKGNDSAEIPMVNGKAAGVAKLYTDEYKYTIPFNHGLKHGVTIIMNDVTVESIPYINGVIHGKKVFENTKFNEKTEYDYENGKINGVAKHYNDGNIIHTISYVDGLKHGVEYEYSYNGIISKETPYNKGKIDGVMKYYLINEPNIGKVFIKTEYKKGVIQNALYFYRSGNIQTENFYNGHTDPELSNEYYENGSKKAVTTRKGDKKYIVKYYMNGNMQYEIVLKDNQNVEQKEYDEDKNLIRAENTSGNTKTVRAYYSNGQLKIDETYSRSGYTGTHRYFNEDGSLVCEINYKKGQAVFGKYGSGGFVDQKEIDDVNNYGRTFKCADSLKYPPYKN